MTQQAIVEGGCTSPRPRRERNGSPVAILSLTRLLMSVSLLTTAGAWLNVWVNPLGFKAAGVLGFLGIILGLAAGWKASSRFERVASLATTLLSSGALVVVALHMAGLV
jgi:hypothetical protein